MSVDAKIEATAFGSEVETRSKQPGAHGVADDRLGPQFTIGGCAVNRKLIRPTLAEVRERSDRDSQHRRNQSDPNRKRVPPEQTHAESFYYKKQMDNRTLMVIVLHDGEELRGSIE